MTAPRSTSAKSTAVAANVVDFDAARKKSKAKKNVGILKAYGRDWHLKRPNQVLVGELEKADTLGSLVEFLIAHIVKDEREDFLLALRDDEDLDIEVVMLLGEKLSEAVYADLPS